MIQLVSSLEVREVRDKFISRKKQMRGQGWLTPGLAHCVPRPHKGRQEVNKSVIRRNQMNFEVKESILICNCQLALYQCVKIPEIT